MKVPEHWSPFLPRILVSPFPAPPTPTLPSILAQAEPPSPWMTHWVESGFPISREEALKSEILGTWLTWSLCASFLPVINTWSLALSHLPVFAPHHQGRAFVPIRHPLFSQMGSLQYHSPGYSLGKQCVSLSLCFCPWSPSDFLSLLPETQNFLKTRSSLQWLPITFRVKISADKRVHKEAQRQLPLRTNDSSDRTLPWFVLLRWGLRSTCGTRWNG